MPRFSASFVIAFAILSQHFAAASNSTLPDGTEFPMWEEPMRFTKTYYVNAQAANADDTGPGSEERPFKTINRAAQVLQPGERVVIAEGVYREFIQPARGGTGPGAMISYEAAPGAKVVVKGSRTVADWKPSKGWRIGVDPATGEQATAWQLDLDPALFPNGYNPFAVDNVIGNRYWINYANDNMATYFRRRGLVFADGRPLEPVESPTHLAAPSTRSLNFWSDVRWTPLFEEFSPYAGKFWVEPHGQRLHIRLAGDADPADHTIEITTQEQLFAPAERYQSYIRVKGITFVHAGNGFPVPQRGMVSVNRGHHFIFEDNTFEWANSVGLDIGNEDWAASPPPHAVGFDVVRGNTFRYCGIEGLGGTGGPENTLVERNLFEWIGWQDAVRMSESGGTKMHGAKNLLFRHNIIRHIRHGNGIWIDIANANCRITGNLFADIPGGVNPHAVHIEGSWELNMIDNNVFDSLTGAILIRDTNNVIVAYNLFVDCEEAAVDTRSGIGGPRAIRGRTLEVRNVKVHGNVFLDIGRAPIEFTNVRNEADGNIYGAAASANPWFAPTIIRVKSPEPPQWHNLESAREDLGWEKDGAMANVSADLDPDALTLTLAIEGDVKPLPPFHGIDTDFYGNPVAGQRPPGPFSDVLTHSAARSIDPR
ncbi:right-handed parallel beta-helix repeat-containing protein [Congregicoccus parvus]|uniref:right-handed parallel beta-helix repeat-containing protein n=1 Tax=Congregicoccus parvus TaxID=3081749 RepID=UPI003FA5691D